MSSYSPDSPYTDEQIAQVAHNLNAVIREAEGEPRPELWDELQDDAWQRKDSLRQVRSIRENPAYSPKDDHDAWKMARIQQGWKLGPEHDRQKKTNPLLVDWEKLPFRHRTRSMAGFLVIQTMLGKA